jgi:1,4-dihydroxy-2-naphthoate polyprenyltransferase
MGITESRFSLWLRTTRPFSFTASITPVIIGASLAHQSNMPVQWHLLPLFLICALLLHAATNLISDYSDYKKGVDREYTLGSSGVLAHGLLTAQAVKVGANVLYAVAFILGLSIVVRYLGAGIGRYGGWLLLYRDARRI